VLYLPLTLLIPRSLLANAYLTIDSLSSNDINGGATRDRTADLLNANQALSHLSYSPSSSLCESSLYKECLLRCEW
jgi:hypothetical protein